VDSPPTLQHGSLSVSPEFLLNQDDEIQKMPLKLRVLVESITIRCSA
jgi:hypothetical protein